jgi:hypothetical protein
MKMTMRVNATTCSTVRLTVSDSLSTGFSVFGQTLASRAPAVNGALGGSHRCVADCPSAVKGPGTIVLLPYGGAANAAGVNLPANSRRPRGGLVEG